MNLQVRKRRTQGSRFVCGVTLSRYTQPKRIAKIERHSFKLLKTIRYRKPVALESDQVLNDGNRALGVCRPVVTVLKPARVVDRVVVLFYRLIENVDPWLS
jgi:hypothetical protein